MLWYVLITWFVGACVVMRVVYNLFHAQTYATKDRIIMVTGAGKGVGCSLVHELLRSGNSVIAVDIDSDALNKLKAEYNKACASESQRALLRVAVTDIGDEKSVTMLGEQLASWKLSHLDVLVNCAGLLSFQPWCHKNSSMEDIGRIMRVNYLGTVMVTRLALPLLQKSRALHRSLRFAPRVINMSSQAGRVAQCFTGPYNASKFAVEAFSDSLRQELAPLGILVVKVQPGMIAPGPDNAGRDMVARANQTVTRKFKDSTYWPRLRKMVEGGEQHGHLVAIPQAKVVTTIRDACFLVHPHRAYPLYNFTTPWTRDVPWFSLEPYLRQFPTLSDGFSKLAY